MTQLPLAVFLAPRASRASGPASSLAAEYRAGLPAACTERGRVLALLDRMAELADRTRLRTSWLEGRDVNAVQVRQHLWHLARRGLAEAVGERACEVAGTLAQTWRAR